jgi:hypothetical protein
MTGSVAEANHVRHDQVRPCQAAHCPALYRKRRASTGSRLDAPGRHCESFSTGWERPAVRLAALRRPALRTGAEQQLPSPLQCTANIPFEDRFAPCPLTPQAERAGRRFHYSPFYLRKWDGFSSSTILRSIVGEQLHRTDSN